MTINELLAAAGLTGDDVIPMYDAEAAPGTEPTQKIKASDFVSAMKTLGSLLSQSDVVNNLVINETKPVSSGAVFNDVRNLESLTVTKGANVSLASWGSISAYKIGRMLIVIGTGLRFSAASGELCTITGIKASKYTVGTGFVEGANERSFFMTLSPSGNGNVINYEGVVNLNSNAYFELFAFVD